jgi:hypothetical protein
MRSSLGALLVLLSGCNASGQTDFVTREDGLTVGGYHCPQGAGDTRSDIPADGIFYISTFEGGAPMSCHHAPADGVSLYIADRDRWPCDSHVRLIDPRALDPRAETPLHLSCVVEVADRGPNVCVEEAAGKAMVDASPVITRYLFGIDQSGWSDHREVIAIATSDDLGCGTVTEDVLDSPADGGPEDAGAADAGSPCQSDLDCNYWEFCDASLQCEGLACGGDDTSCNAGLPGLGVVCGDAGVCTRGCHSDADCEDAQVCDVSVGDGVCG